MDDCPVFVFLFLNHFTETQDGISFTVEGSEDAQITVGHALIQYNIFFLFNPLVFYCGKPLFYPGPLRLPGRLVTTNWKRKLNWRILSLAGIYGR